MTYEVAVPDVSASKAGEAASRAGANDVVLRQLITQMGNSVYFFALRITGDIEDAKDVQQQAWLKVYRKLEQFKGHSLVSAWVNKIAINEARIVLRKRRSRSDVCLDETVATTFATVARKQCDSSLDGPEFACWRNELNCVLRCAIASLRPANRAAFILTIVEERSTKEAAKTLRISQSGVRTRMWGCPLG